jgi:hypothetical protein
MNSSGKIVNLWLFFLFTLVFISPQWADPDDDYDSAFFEASPLILEVPGFELRSFNDIFPGLSRIQKANVMNDIGARGSFEKNDVPSLIPGQDSGINLLSGVMAKNPSHIIEALILVPYNRRVLDLLDIYNGLRKIKNIQNHTIPMREGKKVKIFKDTTRLESAQNRRPAPDPPRADTLPYSETMYLRFVDQYLGDLYIRGNVSVSLYGITYSLTNFRDVFFTIFRVMKAESFSTLIYLEPVKEGVLIYSLSGIYIPNFVASKVNLTPNINSRLTAMINWITEGLREEENYSQHNLFYQQQ